MCSAFNRIIFPEKGKVYLLSGLLIFYSFTNCKANDAAIVASIKDGLKKVEIVPTASKSELIKIYSQCFELEKQLKQPNEISIELHEKFGSLLNSVGSNTLSIEHNKIAMGWVQRLGEKRNGHLYFLLSSIGSAFMLQRNWDSCGYYFKKALAESFKNNDAYTRAAAMNNYGIYWQKISRIDSAIVYFNSALHYFDHSIRGDLNFKIGIQDNLAQCFLLQKKLSLARDYYLKNLKLATEIVRPFRQSQALEGLVETYLAENNFTALPPLFVQIENALDNSKNHARFMELKYLYEWQKLQYYVGINNTAESLKQQNKIKNLLEDKEFVKATQLDRSLSELMQLNIKNLRTELEIKTQLAQSESQKRRLYGWIIALGFILSIGAVTSLYTLKNRRIAQQNAAIEIANLENSLQQLKIKNQILENQKLQTELQQKQSDLTNTSVLSVHEMKLKQVLLKKLKVIVGKKEADIIPALKQYITELQLLTLPDEKNKVLLENIENVNARFFDNLKQQFPNLTKSEIELCGLIKSKLNNKEIASLKNISYESIKMAKNRLKKKLGLDADDSLSEFIQSFG